MKKVVGLGACVLDTLISCDKYPVEDTKQKIRKGQEKKHCGDRLYINNGKECKHIRAHNFPFYQSQGWKIGRLRKGEKKDAD